MHMSDFVAIVLYCFLLFRI